VGVAYNPFVRKIYKSGLDLHVTNLQVNLDIFRFEMTKQLEYMLGLTEWIVHPLVQEKLDDSTGLYDGLSVFFLFYYFFFLIIGSCFYTVVPQTAQHPFGTKENHAVTTFYGKYMPDMTNGINKMFVYCDEVLPSIVGNTPSRLWCIVNLEMEKQGSGTLCSYAPPDVSRKLIKAKIKDLHISLRDTENERINFSAGTVNIECVVE
jgi:hypothetical protein